VKRLGECCDDIPAPAAEASLGVLFVHGMGTHAQGSTLRDFGEPLVDWLMRGERDLGAVTLTSTVLTPGDGEPARVTCVLPGGHGEAPRTWLLAESCWSDCFEAASYPRIAFWLIASVPWMLGDYMRGAIARESARRNFTWRPLRWIRKALIACYALLGALLSGPLIIVLTALLVVRLIPVKAIRIAVDRLPRLLASSLGDVYVILATHVDRAAIRSRIVRDHDWLRARCTAVVIVAHSAGSAVTHQLIRDGRIPRCTTYVTLGEAIWRMHWMTELSRGPHRIEAVGLAVTGTLLIGAGAFAGAVVDLAPWLHVVLVAAGLVLHVVSARLVGSDQTADDRTDAIEALSGKVDRWRDYVASSDPVPAGALTEDAHNTTPAGRGGVAAPPRALEHYEPVGIRNRRSIALDHTTYVANAEQFVAPLAGDLLRADPALLAPLGLELERRMLEAAGRARALRTLSLALMRFTSGLLGAVVLLSLWAQDGASATAGRHVAWLGGALRRVIVPDALDAQVTDGRVGLVAVLAALVAGWLLAGRAWRIWERVDRGRLYAGRPASGYPWPHLALAAWWLACSTAAAWGTMALTAMSRSWRLPVALALVAGFALLARVRRVAEVRDKLYA
jgi:hypothetical protein